MQNNNVLYLYIVAYQRVHICIRMNKIGLKNAGVRVQLQAAAARPRLFAFHIIIQAFHTPGFSYSMPPPHLDIISRESFIFNHTRQSTQLSKNDRDQKRRKQKENFWDYSPQQASKVCQFLSLSPYPEILNWNSTDLRRMPLPPTLAPPKTGNLAKMLDVCHHTWTSSHGLLFAQEEDILIEL